MNNTILAIREKVPQSATLPDGYYYGIWGGYIIVVDYNGKKYELEVMEGVRGVGFRVVVLINGDVMEYHQLKN
jgi:hypothetical protein